MKKKVWVEVMMLNANDLYEDKLRFIFYFLCVNGLRIS